MNPAMIIMCIGICQKLGLLDLLEAFLLKIIPGLSSLSPEDQAKIKAAIADALVAMSGVSA